MHYFYENFPFAGLDTLPDVVDAQLVNSKEENNFSMETSLHEFFFNVKNTHLSIDNVYFLSQIPQRSEIAFHHLRSECDETIFLHHND